MARPRTSKRVSEKETGAILPTTKNALTSRGKALVFISHDSRDADLAEFFANLLSDVSGGTLKSFRSSDKKGTSGIEFGTEWYTSIMSQLGEATDVVALLTQQSIDRPWILYEAGVAKGKLDTNVLGVSVGVPLEKLSTGPFGQFQNCGDDEDSLTKLVMQLLQRNPDASPREEAVRRQVHVFREEIAKVIANKDRGDSTEHEDGHETNIAKIFEEVKVMVRELSDRVDDRVWSRPKRFTHSVRGITTNAQGIHLLIELTSCNRQKIGDPDYLERIMVRAAETAGATILKTAFHDYNPQGVSGMVMVPKSHLSIHTWPEYGYAALDIFMCGSEIDPWKAANFLNEYLEAEEIQIRDFRRGLSVVHKGAQGN